MENILNSSTRNLKLTRKSVLRDSAGRITASYLFNLIFGQHVMPVARASRRAGANISAFIGHVSIVVGPCSKKQMRRAYTVGNIAAMKYAQSVWDWAVFTLKCQSVCCNGLTLEAQYSVTKRLTGTGPQPARLSFYSACPQAVYGRFSSDAKGVKIRVGHFVFSNTESVMSRLVRGLTTAFGPFVF